MTEKKKTEDPKVRAALMMAVVLAEAIQELGSVPAGHLYARVMDKMTLDVFETIIGALVKAGVVRRDRSHMLMWIGPARPARAAEPGK